MLINIYHDHTTVFIPDEIDIEEEDRRSLPDRIKEAIDEYGMVSVDRETSKKFFNAKWEDFVDALLELFKEGYIVHSYIEKGIEEND